MLNEGKFYPRCANNLVFVKNRQHIVFGPSAIYLSAINYCLSFTSTKDEHRWNLYAYLFQPCRANKLSVVSAAIYKCYKIFEFHATLYLTPTPLNLDPESLLAWFMHIVEANDLICRMKVRIDTWCLLKCWSKPSNVSGYLFKHLRLHDSPDIKNWKYMQTCRKVES